jgi:hypothetical protein
MNTAERLLETPFLCQTIKDKLHIKKLSAFQPKDIEINEYDGKKIKNILHTAV